MLIALHATHHSLPFWHRPKQPNELFDPETHAKVIFHGQSEREKVLVKDTFMWPILMGISAIDLPQVMAHVSAFCPCIGDGSVHWAKRKWVQFTTVPEEKVGEIPLVVKGEKVQVQHLWGGDNGTYSPFDFLKDRKDDDPLPDASFWKNFFLKELRDAKRETLSKAAKASRKAEELTKLYEVVT